MSAPRRMSASRTALRRATIGTTLAMACFLPSLVHASDGEDWRWIVAPYLWGISIDTDLQRTQPPEGGLSTSTGFDDILDKFDGAFEIHIEGQQEQWGMFTDFTYLGLADSNDFPRFHTESDLDTRLFELAGVWSPAEGRFSGLDVFAGLRYIDLDLSVQFVPDNPLFNTTSFDGGDSYNDFMIGARYTWALSDHWGLTLRGDGSFGDTEGTWNASVVTNYKTTHGAWFIGYRYLAVELETVDSAIDLTASGPVVGYGFVF